MGEYSIQTVVQISMYTEVRADSLKDALKKAQQRGVQSLCHQCASGEPKQEWVTSGELDGEPYVSPLASITVDGEEISKWQMRAAKKLWRDGV